MDAGVSERRRIPSLDYMRAYACLMVLLTHSCEPFYMGEGDVVSIASRSDLLWISILDGFSRMATVPLFVLISSYLLLPLRTPVGKFFKRRFERVGIPFILWTILYCILPWIWGEFSSSQVGEYLLHSLLNFPPNAGHLWFIYMLIGMYLFMPVISPWLESVSKRGEEAFLWVWAVTTLMPYLREITSELFGQSYWNEFHMLWNFSGYLGYMVLAHYIKTYVEPGFTSRKKVAAICVPVIVVCILATQALFYFRTPSCVMVPQTELPWIHTSTIIAVLNAATFILMLGIKRGEGLFYRIVKDISEKSYGMYLCHLLILGAFGKLYTPLMPTPLAIVATALSTYVAAYILMKLLSFLPKGKYLTG